MQDKNDRAMKDRQGGPRSTGHDPDRERAGGPLGHGGGWKDERQDGEIGQHRDETPASTDPATRDNAPGRSESSPGHMKKAAGERSARDFAPGHAGGRGKGRGR